MIDCNLEYYRTFYYVARLGSASGAAQALCLSQPTVTYAVKRLEKGLGYPLFERVPRGMKLTPEGEVLFRHVSAAFGELQTGEQEARELTQGTGGRLFIGATETAIYTYLLPKIAAFRKAYPGVRVHITGSSTADTVSMLRNGKADMALAVTPVEDTAGISVRRLSAFRDIFVAGNGFEKFRGRTISVKELCQNPIAAVEKGTSARRHLDGWFAGQGILFDPEYSVRTSTTILPFVENDLAIGILPAFFAQEKISLGKVFEVSTDRQIPPREMVLLTQQGKQPSKPFLHFMQYLI